MLSILGLSFAGLNIVARLKMLAAWLAITGAVVIGGYVYGRIDGRKLCEAEAAATAAAVRRADEAQREVEAEAIRAEIEVAAKRENANDAISEILMVPEAGDDSPCVSGEWLRGLGRLR